jgi:hypothetical protein
MWSYFIQEGNIVLASPMDKNRIKQVFYVKITVESDLGRHGFPITQFSFCKCQKSIGQQKFDLYFTKSRYKS